MTHLSYTLLLLLPQLSPISSDEVVVFFPTAAHLDPRVQEWVLPIHGWIHEPEEDDLLRNAALDQLREALDLRKEDMRTAIFKKRARLFLVDNERGENISIRLGGRSYPVGESSANGHFQGTVRLSQKEARQLLAGTRSLAPWLTYRAVTRPGDPRRFEGRVQLLPEKGISVISDIDDTIKITEVNDKRALLANTFLRELRPVPGMAGLYKGWADQGAAFHYVSTSPWQLYQPLAGLLDESGFPVGSFHLLPFRWKDSTFFNLLRSSEETKPRAIEPLLKRFPARRFILVGDSGEHDPEIYGKLARRYPGQIHHILIRDVTGEGDDSPRYRAAFAGLKPGQWTIFRKPEEVPARVIPRTVP